MADNHPLTLSDRLRSVTKQYGDWLGRVIAKAGIHPDWITIAGLALVAVAAVMIARGEFMVAFVLVLLGLPMDFLDGAVARAIKREGQFGQVLDSMLDRYADGFLFSGFSYYFATQDRLDMMTLSLAAMVGSFLVSYTRARADGVNVAAKVGLFTRFERVFVISVMLLIPALITIGMWILAIGSNFTALQRLWFVYKALQEREVE